MKFLLMALISTGILAWGVADNFGLAVVVGFGLLLRTAWEAQVAQL